MKGFFDRLGRREFTTEFAYTVTVAVVLTLVTYLFAQIELTKDRMEPFKSIGFVLGSGAVFYFAVTFGTRQALYLASGMVTLTSIVWMQMTTYSVGQIIFQLVLLGI